VYSMITERVPASLFFMHSFMVQLLDRAEKAFPSITPDSVIDASPAMKPMPLRGMTNDECRIAPLPNSTLTTAQFVIRHSSFVIRHSSFAIPPL